MKKKLIIAAVGAAVVAVAGVAQADVKVSGYGNLSLDQIKGCKTSACTTADGNSNALNVSSNSSYIKFDAAEDLGGGLKAIFSWTEYLRVDNNSSGAQVSGGNTIGGLAGDFGVVAMGSHDTGAKLAGRAVDLFGNQIGDSRNANVANNRAPNVIAYLSPNWSGFSFVLGHSTNTGTTTQTAGSNASVAATAGGASLTAATDTSPADKQSIQADTLLLSYANGPLTIVVGYDKAKLGDPNLPAASALAGTPTAGLTAPKWQNAGVKYSFPTGTDVVAFYQNETAVGAVKDYDVKTMGIGAKQTFGNNAVKVQYYEGKLKVASGETPDKPKLLAVGFDHAFSKTVTGYVAYAEMKNSNKTGALTNWVATAGGHGDQTPTIAGEKSSAISVGMTFAF